MIDWRLRAALAALAMTFLGILPAQGHDFWVQPADYWVIPGVDGSFTLQVGHGPFRQRSLIPLSRILRFEGIGPEELGVDLRPRLQLGGRTSDGATDFPKQGTYVLVLQTDTRAYSLLPAIRFNDYLRYEGLTPALDYRERTHRMAMDGSEKYSRQAKALLQVGKPSGPQPQVTKPVGLVLEIVPDVDPYATPRPKTLPVHVLYRGRRLAGALVMLTNLEHDANPVEVHLTDRNGEAEFATPPSGEWLLNVIWTEVTPPSSDTDFETTFSSLSFGFPGH
jgi:uncharacterized GH25 family protein